MEKKYFGEVNQGKLFNKYINDGYGLVKESFKKMEKELNYLNSYVKEQRKNIPISNNPQNYKKINEAVDRIKTLKGLLGIREKKIFVFFFIATFILSLFFLSPVLTGNVISNIPFNNSNNLGILFFTCSLVCLFFYLRIGK